LARGHNNATEITSAARQRIPSTVGPPNPALADEEARRVAHQFGLCVAHMVCATIATPLVEIYQWRITICATHSLHFSGAYAICAIRILCMAHIAKCATNAKCATSH
jgi:hypothetical protein